MGFDMVQVSLASACCTMEERLLLVDNRDSFTWVSLMIWSGPGQGRRRQAAECRLADADGMAGIDLVARPGPPVGERV